MKTCMVFPNKEATYSETFISNHLKNLCLDFSVSSGWMPYFDLQRGSIFNFPLDHEFVRKLIKIINPGAYKKFYDDVLAAYLKYNQINTVFAEYGITGANVLNACKRTHTQLVVHFHGFDAFHYDTVNAYKESYYKMFEYAKAIIVVSEDMKNQLAALGAPIEKIVKIPYGVDITKFNSTNLEKSGHVFVAVGRFTLKKAPQITIRAFSRVLSEVPDAQLVMIGDGELFNECKTLVSELGINENIKFKGVLKPEEVIEWLKVSNYFVQHSVRGSNGDSEGMPNSILEAAACGLPIISTIHAGIKEAVDHGISGFLTNEGDEVQMAQYMIELAKNKQLAKIMGIKGRDIVLENYNLEKQIAELKQVILS